MNFGVDVVDTRRAGVVSDFTLHSVAREWVVSLFWQPWYMQLGFNMLRVVALFARSLIELLCGCGWLFQSSINRRRRRQS